MRKGALQWVVLATAFLSLSISAQPVSGWGNGGYSSNPAYPDYGIHDWIADKALAFQMADVTFLLTTYHADYLIGTEAPDNGAYIGDSYNHHVYYGSTAVLESDVGASRAREMYGSALASLKSSDYEQAAYYAGAMAHYISDLGAYGHTMGSSTDWGASPHHSDYESHVGSLIGTLKTPVFTNLLCRDPYNTTLDLAREITFGSGAIKANTWMESNYNWEDPMFRASCLASLNESVRAVAAALGQLLSEAGVSAIPEFWSPVLVIVGVCAVMVAIRRRVSSQS